MSVLICGSMAYDTIMLFHDKFKNHILPEKIHNLNVSFPVPDMRREFGGCAGNIAYNLKLLGEEPYIMATVGHDFEPYAQWLNNCQISADYIKVIDNNYTGQAYITTDEDGNQITAFHPGAMNLAHENSVSSVPNEQEISLGIISPESKEGMQLHAREFAKQEIPFVFDPGQGMPMFNGDELLELLDLASYAALNDYEAAVMQEKTGLSQEQIATYVDGLVITMGGEGSIIYTQGQRLKIPVAKANKLVDPTGCGDAYRAGLLHGIRNNYSWEITGRIASLLGAIKIECHGTQNHSFTISAFKQRYFENFGHSF